MYPPHTSEAEESASEVARTHEPVRQEEEEEGAVLFPFVTYSASYIRFLKLLSLT